MAFDITKILVGANSLFKLAPWVTAKGAGTFVDVGATLGGVSLAPKTDYHQVFIDQRLGPVSAIPIKREYEVKVKMLQADMENLRFATGQPAANKTGTPPNETLKIDFSAVEQYYQGQFVEPGIGSTKTRTVTLWRCYPKDLAPIPAKKDEEQAYELTVGVLEETTGTGVDSILIVDT